MGLGPAAGWQASRGQASHQAGINIGKPERRDAGRPMPRLESVEGPEAWFAPAADLEAWLRGVGLAVCGKEPLDLGAGDVSLPPRWLRRPRDLGRLRDQPHPLRLQQAGAPVSQPGPDQAVHHPGLLARHGIVPAAIGLNPVGAQMPKAARTGCPDERMFFDWTTRSLGQIGIPQVSRRRAAGRGCLVAHQVGGFGLSLLCPAWDADWWRPASGALAATAMTDLLRVIPQAAPMVADLVAGMQDWPEAEGVANRRKKALPPSMVEDDGKPQQPLQPP